MGLNSELRKDIRVEMHPEEHRAALKADMDVVQKNFDIFQPGRPYAWDRLELFLSAKCGHEVYFHDEPAMVEHFVPQKWGTSVELVCIVECTVEQLLKKLQA